jgi:glycosyltransferase involved in cell wall biosynthesis
VGHQDDVRPYFAMSDIFVFPSYREGFPNVVLEAGGMGLPSIVTDINGSNEIIENNINGIIVPSKDTDALFNAMQTCIENSEFMNKMANCCRDRIATLYDRNVVWNEILAEYRLIERSSRNNNA